MTVAESRQHGSRDTANGHEKVTQTSDQRSPLLAVALELGLVAAAVLAAVLAAAGVQQSTALRPLAAVVITAVTLVTGLRAISRHRRSLLDPEADRKRPVLGEAVLVRAVSAAAATTLFAAGVSVASVALAVLAAAVLVVSALLESVVHRLSRQPAPVVANLPGVPPLPVLPAMDHLAVGGGLAATALGAVLGLAGVSPLWWLVLAAWAAFPVAAIAYVGAQRLQRAKRLRRVIPLAVQRYAPELVLFTARPDDAGYQVAMWLPYLRATGRRFVVLTRDELPALALTPLLGSGDEAVPVVSCRRAADLEGCLPDTVRAVCYVNASSGNGAMVRYSHLRHVYLGHGDSDKPPSYNPTHAMFDTIFAAGPAAVRRYAEHGVRIDPDKFVVTGRPQVADVAAAVRPPAGVIDPVVLYAPTWRGHVSETALSSLPRAERIVARLLARGATVVFRPHPFSHDFPADEAVIRRVHALLAADAKRSGRSHLWGAAAESERSVLDCLNASDLLLSDVSSVVSDYLFSGKPYAMFAVDAAASFVADYPVARAAYVVPADPGTDDAALGTALDAALESMLSDDPLAAARRETRADQLAVDADSTTDPHAYAQRFVDAVASVVDAPRPDTGEIVESDDGTPAVASSRIRAVLVVEATEVAVAGLALVGLGFALAVGPGWLVALPLVVALALGGLLQLRTARADLVAGGDGADAVDRFTVGRGIALVAGASALLLSPVLDADPAVALGGLVAVAVIGGVAGALALAGEGTIAAAWSDPGVEAVDVPGLDLTVTEAVPRGLVALAGSAAVLLATLMLALVPTGAPAWLWAVPLAAQLVVAVAVLVPALRRLTLARAAAGQVPAAVAALAPELCLYFGSGIGATYQAGMWLRWLAAIDRPMIVVTRTLPSLREIAAVAARQGLRIPILYRPTLRSLEAVLVPSLTTAFYVNNALKNTHFIERRELTHVWLNHGDSEKPACYNPVHAIYDLIFAAGQAGIDRYARHGVHLPAEKFRIVGRPQASVIEVATGPVPSGATVLYAPTWQGPYGDSRVSSLPLGRAIVQALLDRGATVIFRAHPFSYRYDEPTRQIAEIGALLAADREQTGRAHRFGPAAEQAMTVEECFNAADAMVSDVSATLSDFLMSAKPYAVVSVGRDRNELVADVPAAAGGYVIADDLDDLDAALDDLLQRDPLAAERRRLRAYYLGDFSTQTYAEGFLTAARAVVDGRDR